MSRISESIDVVENYENPLIHTEVETLGEAGFTAISRDRQSGTYAADYMSRGIVGRPRRGAGDASPGGKRRRADLDLPFPSMRLPRSRCSRWWPNSAAVLMPASDQAPSSRSNRVARPTSAANYFAPST